MMPALLLLVIAAVAHAQAPATYDVNAIITRALAANPTVRAARQAVTTAEAKVAEARAAGLPKVQGEAGYLALDASPSFSVPSMGTLTFGKTDNPWANVSMDWPLYTGGIVRNMIAASRQGVDAAWQGHARTRQEVAAEAATAYYQVLSAGQMVEVMKAQVATLQEAVRVANGLHDQGVVAKLDVLRPTAELAGAQTQLTQAENGVALALANLRRLLDVPADTPVTLAPPPVAVLPAIDLAAATQTALKQRPEVKALQSYQRATDAQREIARAGLGPTVGMHAQYDIERASTYPDMGWWTLAVVVRQPLFDGGASKAQQAAATSQRDELRAKADALRQGITLQVTNAVLNLTAAEKGVQSAAQEKAVAEEAFNAATVSYKNQVVPMLDVLAAQTALTHARTQLALAEFNRHAAMVQYHLAVGDAPDAAQPK
jgi:outer membrane protein TolC